MARVACFLLEPTGEERTEERPNGLLHEPLYRRSDTGEITTIRDAPPGAMWRAPWYTFIHSQDEDAVLCVKLPDGCTWIIDDQSSNCGLPEDVHQEKHHCWVRHGIPPNITVDKNGPTCSAGAGSIQSTAYHGFLRDGYLVD